MSSKDHERRDALPVGTVLHDFTIQAVIGHGDFGIGYRSGHNERDLTETRPNSGSQATQSTESQCPLVMDTLQ